MVVGFAGCWKSHTRDDSKEPKFDELQLNCYFEECGGSLITCNRTVVVGVLGHENSTFPTSKPGVFALIAIIFFSTSMAIAVSDYLYEILVL